jgi:hypothetical protein
MPTHQARAIQMSVPSGRYDIEVSGGASMLRVDPA